MAATWWTIYVGSIAPASQAPPPNKSLVAIVNNSAGTVVTIKRVKFMNNSQAGTSGALVYMNLSRWSGCVNNHVIYPSVQMFPVPWDESSSLSNDVLCWTGGVMTGTEKLIRPVLWETQYPQNRQSTSSEIKATAGKSNIVYGALTDSSRQQITLRPGQIFAVTVQNYAGTARNLDVVVDFTCE